MSQRGVLEIASCRQSSFHCFLQMHPFCFSHSQVLSPPIHFQGQNKVVFICSCWFGIFLLVAPSKTVLGLKLRKKKCKMKAFLVLRRSCLACHKPRSQDLSEMPLRNVADGCAFSRTKEAAEASLLSFCLGVCTRKLGSFLVIRGKPPSQVSLLLKGIAFFCVH